MACEICDDKGWVCDAHPHRPWRSFSKRADACGCSPGIPCFCNSDPLTDTRHGGRLELIDAEPTKPTIH